MPEADTVIDASGKIVCPGFIDIHMHEDPVEADGKIYSDEEKSIFHWYAAHGRYDRAGRKLRAELL